MFSEQGQRRREREDGRLHAKPLRCAHQTAVPRGNQVEGPWRPRPPETGEHVAEAGLRAAEVVRKVRRIEPRGAPWKWRCKEAAGRWTWTRALAESKRGV